MKMLLIVVLAVGFVHLLDRGFNHGRYSAQASRMATQVMSSFGFR